MVATSGNGVVGTTTLDSLGRISSLTYTNGSGGVIDGFSYAYDADGNVLSKTNLVLSNDSETYGYDNLNRLTSFTRGSSTTESWNYDVLGNWNSSTINGGTPISRSNNAQNQATSIGSATLNYDANGNTLSNQVTGQTYVYDAWNRLVKVNNSAGKATLASYSYDALGRRITQTYGTTTTDLYYSNTGQVIEEQQGGVTVAQYVWSPFYVNQLVQQTNSHGTFYVQQDANYNVTSLTNSAGTVVERYVYDPYGGQVTVLNAAGSTLGIGMASSAYGQIVGFQGGWTDIESGLIHFGERDLNPLTGQWNTADPTGAMYVNGPNRDQLEMSNPVAMVDPTGLAGGGGEEDDDDIEETNGGRADWENGRYISVQERAQRSHDRMMEIDQREAEAARAEQETENQSQRDEAKKLEDKIDPTGAKRAAAQRNIDEERKQAQQELQKAKEQANKDNGGTTPCPDAEDENKGPSANNGNGKKHGGDPHNDAIDKEIDDLQNDDAVTNIRKNQVQVDIEGNRVGNNRPDVQYDRDGVHYNVEYDNDESASSRHGEQIQQNDPSSSITLILLGKKS